MDRTPGKEKIMAENTAWAAVYGLVTDAVAQHHRLGTTVKIHISVAGTGRRSADPDGARWVTATVRGDVTRRQVPVTVTRGDVASAVRRLAQAGLGDRAAVTADGAGRTVTVTYTAAPPETVTVTETADGRLKYESPQRPGFAIMVTRTGTAVHYTAGTAIVPADFISADEMRRDPEGTWAKIFRR